MNAINKKKTLISLSSTAVVLITIIVIGASFAYFENYIDDTKAIDTLIKSKTSDSQLFIAGDPLHIYATPSNFAAGSGSLESSTYAQTTLRANNVNGYAEKYYYVYLQINDNSFIYTTDDRKPELLLQVQDPEGNAFVSGDLFGLEYRSVVGGDGETYEGFDITKFEGVLPLASNYKIASDDSNIETTHNWNVKVIFVNLPENQGANQGHSLEGSLIIDRTPINNLASTYCEDMTIEDCISHYIYTGQSVHGMYYHNSGSHDAYLNSDLEAPDYSLRYSGGNDVVTNYVCFGYPSDFNENDCKDSGKNSNYLYRIIGLFKRDVTYSFSDGGSSYERTIPEWNVKLIKNQSLGNIRRDQYNFNAFTLSDDWKKMVENTFPYRESSANYKTALTMYTAEGANQNSTSYYRLMNTSDYAYAAIPYYWRAENSWENALEQYKRAVDTHDNWLYIGNETTNYYYGQIYNGGNIENRYSTSMAYRPTFFLKHGTLYKDGTGTATDPYILEYGSSYQSGAGTVASPYIPTEGY